MVETFNTEGSEFQHPRYTWDWLSMSMYLTPFIMNTKRWILFRRYCSNVSTTPLRHWGFRQCLPFSWTTLRGIHCRHPIAVMEVVDTFGQRSICYIFKQMNLIIFLYRGILPYATFGTQKKFALAKKHISKIFILCTQ